MSEKAGGCNFHWWNHELWFFLFKMSAALVCVCMRERESVDGRANYLKGKSTSHQLCASPSPLLCTAEPIIRFLETKFSVGEPKEAGAMATVRIPVVRVGDTSKVSVVRVHTKDGSAVSGEDYYPVSQGERRQAAPSLLLSTVEAEWLTLVFFNCCVHPGLKLLFSPATATFRVTGCRIFRRRRWFWLHLSMLASLCGRDLDWVLSSLTK